MAQYFESFTQSFSPKTTSVQKILFTSSKDVFSFSKFIISPKKFENSMREKSNSFIISPKKHIVFTAQPDNNKYNHMFKDVCKKLDFSDFSENTLSNYSISDNENMDINENSYDDLTEIKNSENISLSSSSSTKTKQKKKYKIKNEDLKKELTFISKKQNLNFEEDSLIDTNISKFEEEYVIIKTLCRGEMGTVYLCLRLKDKKKFAVKKTKFFSRKNDYDNMNIFMKDLEKYSNEPGSKFILKYIDFWIEDIFEKNYKLSYNNKNMYIVTDYFSNGNLKDYITKIKKDNTYKDKLTYNFFWEIIFQMISPINFLHKLGYIHSDIKPSNFLINDHYQLIINDFCLSIKEENIRKISSDELEGDSIYISPELFYKNMGTINHKTDIFSLGLSILELLFEGDLPKNGSLWQEIRNREIPQYFFDKIIELKRDNGNDYLNRNKFIELIKDMTQINSELRPELDSLLNNEEKYPELFARYQSLKSGKYDKNICINNYIDVNNCYNYSFLDTNKYISDFINLEKNNESESINKIFIKKSNSMKNLTL